MMKKKGLSIILGGALFFGIVTGCSSNNSSQPAEAEPETPAATEEPEVIKNPVVIYGDTIAGEGCAVSARFKHGDKIVFRATAIDGVTTEQMEEAEVTLILGNGEELPMKLGPHGQKETMLWTVSMIVPDDMPTGTLDYKYVAKIDGQEAEYTPFDVQPTLLTIIADEENSEEEESEEKAES